MHGGAPGSGGPKGARNGNYKHGRYTAEAIASRRWGQRENSRSEGADEVVSRSAVILFVKVKVRRYSPPPPGGTPSDAALSPPWRRVRPSVLFTGRLR
jgi:hypothetical protein